MSLKVYVNTAKKYKLVCLDGYLKYGYRGQKAWDKTLPVILLADLCMHLDFFFV